LLKKLLLFIGLVVAYAAFPTRTYYWDGVLFSLYIEKVYSAELPFSILFHPNHLLYSGFGYGLYSLAHAFGLHLRAITLFQCVNILAGAGAAVLVFALTKRLGRSNWLAVFCCLLFGSGATWWKFSTDANSYILSVLLLLLAVSFLLSGTCWLLLAGMCHVLAMLFHELAVFAYVPFIAAILLENTSRAARIRRACLYTLGTAGSVALVYWLAYRLAGRDSGRTFLGWVTSSSAQSQTTHSLRQVFIAYPASYLKLLAGGKLSLIRDYLSLPVIVALMMCIGSFTIGIWLMRRPKRESGILIDWRTKAVLWSWVLPYLLFLAWWEPGSAFYKLFIWPPLVLLLGCAVAERPFWLSRIKALIALSAALAAWNFGAFIFPHSHSSADPILQLAETIDRELPKNATVYYKVLSPDDWYLEYFAPGRRWLPLPSDTRTVQQLSDSANTPVCLETTALAEFGGRADTGQSWNLVTNKHNVRFACLK